MTKDLINRIHRICGILLTIALIVAGVCLMVQCVGIYRSGDHAYSRETVAAAFQPIAVPIYLCLTLIVISFVLHLVLPGDEKKAPVRKQYAMILKRLQTRTDLSLCGAELRTAVEAERKARKNRRTLLPVLLVAGSAVFLGYALNPSHFHQSEINGSMIRAVILLAGCMAIPFIYAIGESRFRTSSIRREIELLKQAPAEAKIPAEKEPAKDTARAENILRGVVLTVAVVILIFGFCTGGTADVLTKAINICTECVGLG